MENAEELIDRVRQLEARLQQLEDDRAIRELLGRYGFNADLGRSEAYVHLYTEDGALDLTSGPGRLPELHQSATSAAGTRNADEKTGADERGEKIVRHQGHEQLTKFITDPTGHKAIEGRCMHFMGNNLVTHINGDEAFAESYNMTLVRQGVQFVLLNAAINRWTLLRVDGKWLIKECFRRRPGASGVDQVVTITTA